MKFISHKIMNPYGSSASFEDFVQNLLKKSSKDQTDQTDKTEKNNINNDNETDAHSYQEGESVDGKKESSSTDNVVTATCGKEMGECDDAGKVTDKHSPASSTESGSEGESEHVTEQNINNDPNYQKGESVNLKKKPVKASSKSSFKKISSLNQKERLQLFANLSSVKSNPIQYVEAMCGLKFANLTTEEKEWLKKFWLTQYPEAYVNEMIKDR